jgi:hypothetical protein
MVDPRHRFRSWAATQPLRLLLAPLLCTTVVLAVRAQRAPAEDEMPVYGGTAALLRAAGVHAPVEPPRAFLVLARALHGALPSRASGPRLREVQAYLGGTAGRRQGIAVDRVPSLLPRETWERAVFGRAVGIENLAPAILVDRRAALFYYGLFSLDEDTLSFFARRPSLVSAVYRNAAGAFAAFAEGLAVRNGGVVLPGGHSAQIQWERLAGAPAGDPERFIRRLFERDEGRLAWFLDAVGHLDPVRQAFACRDMQRLYATFASFDRAAWPIPRAPFSRRSVVDPEFVLQNLAVSQTAAMAPPDQRWVWHLVFGTGAAVEGASPVDPAWLVEQLVSPDDRARRTRFDTVLFAQRLFARSAAEGAAITPQAAVDVLAAFAGRDGLMMTLESMGFTEPRDLMAAVEWSDRLTAGGDSLRVALRLGMAQAALALVARLGEVGTVTPATARGLARTLFALRAVDDVRCPQAMAHWIESALVAALPDQTGQAPRGIADRLLDALAGVRMGQPTSIIAWEGRRYRVDVAAGGQARLRRIRQKQGGAGLDDALEVGRLASRIADAPSSALTRDAAARLLERYSALNVRELASLFGFNTARVLDDLRSAAMEVQEGRVSPTASDTVTRLGDGLSVLLAEALVSQLYAVGLRTPDSPLLLAGNPARRHDFGLLSRPNQPGPWTIARGTHVGSFMTMVGSLLCLDRALAVHALRPTMVGLPDAAPTLGQRDEEGLGESVVALNPFRLTDRGRDALASAIARGRQRLAAASAPGDLDALAASVGVEGWRRRLIRRAAGAGTTAVGAYFSLGEVLRLGCTDGPLPDVEAWGMPRRAIDGSLAIALPEKVAWHPFGGRLASGLLTSQVADLQLRVVEWLAELKLPAALAPDVLSYASWDLAWRAQMADFDDWLAVMRAAQALSADRVADYVSALASDGPLVELRK